MKHVKNIVIIGAGNVGTRLACALNDAGCNIVQIAGRRSIAVETLAKTLDTDFTLSLAKIIKGQDLYILALPDNAMEEVLGELDLTDELLVHTSGSVPMEILIPFSENVGVFYPLQTFTRNREIDLKVVPFLMEANRIDTEDSLVGLGKMLSANVNVADSEKRLQMHVAAVFASNFSNHMYDIAREIMQDNGFDFDLLVPLITETAAKAVEMGPDNSQTGPALRKDMEIIAKHLELLKNKPAARELYDRISKNIIDQTH